MTLMYKIVNGLSGVDKNLFTFRVTDTRYANIQFVTTQEQTFSHRIIICGTYYYRSYIITIRYIVEAPTIIDFKLRLDNHLNNSIY